MTPRELAYVAISGPGQHEEVTKALRFKPSEAWNPGDIDPRNGKARTSMKWILRSGLDDKQRLEEHIRSLIVILGTRTDELRTLWVDFNIVLQCVAYLPSWTHGVHLDREVVRQAALLGCAIDFDLYFIPERHES